MNVLRQHLPILNEISEDARSRIKHCIVANRDDNLSVMVKYPQIYVPVLLDEFDIEISEKLMGVLSRAVHSVIIDLDSLKTNKIRLYIKSDIQEVLEHLGVELPDNTTEDLDKRWGIGLLYDLTEDAVVEYKDYYGHNYQYGKQYKYDADLNPISEVDEVADGDFNDLTGLIDDLNDINAFTYVTNRTQVQRSYVSVKL